MIPHSGQGVSIRITCLRAEGPRRRHRDLDGLAGDCFDNAAADSFFATPKKSSCVAAPDQTRREPQSAAFDYIETFYSRERRHSTLGYLSRNKQKVKPRPLAEVGKDQSDPSRAWSGLGLGMSFAATASSLVSLQ